MMPQSQGLAQVERLFFILQYLSHHESATAQELAEHCGTSKRSIYRDMRKLEDQGFFISSDSHFGYSLIEKSILSGGRLNTDEWMALTLYPMLSQGITSGEHPFHHAYQSGLEKVLNYVQKGTGLSNVGAGLGERIRLHDRATEPAQFNVMPAILNAISENRSMDVTYYTIHRDEKTCRCLDPYYLVPREGHLYVIAYCHSRKDVRVFRLSRFQDVNVTEETFKIPRTFNINDFLSQRWSIISEDVETDFRVRFSSEAARYVQEEDFHVQTKRQLENDGSLILETTVKSQEEFLRWIRSFGTRAEVLKPLEVRIQLAKEYRLLLDKYEEKAEN